MKMTRRPSFTQARVSRAVRGAIKGGLAVSRVEIDASGKIVVICSEDAPAAPDRQETADGWEARLRRARGWDK
jgi:hypothetical protein